jgi:hypothetical protein
MVETKPSPELENCTAWPPAGTQKRAAGQRKIKISVKPSNH